jgi:hypothetical protein
LVCPPPHLIPPPLQELLTFIFAKGTIKGFLSEKTRHNHYFWVKYIRNWKISSGKTTPLKAHPKKHSRKRNHPTKSGYN